jgi:hypothetical protein
MLARQAGTQASVVLSTGFMCSAERKLSWSRAE